MTKIEIDGDIDTLKVDGEDVELPVVEPDPDPDPDPDPNGELEELIEAAVTRVILEAPDYPDEFKVDGAVDARDFSVTISHDELWKSRINEWPIGGTTVPPAPIDPTNSRTLGTISIVETGARGQSYGADTAAFIEADKRVPDGGTVFTPHGRWKVSGARLTGAKDVTFLGEGESGAELIGQAGKDTLIFDDDDLQRRGQNRKIFRQMRWFMPGNGNRGPANRQTQAGWQAGAACLAFLQTKATDDGNRKKAWGPSHIFVENCTAHGEKDALGACFLWSERVLYSMEVQNLFIGNHGASISGLHGGVILGEPRFPPAEYAPDKLCINNFTHWGGVTSISAANVANGHIEDLEVYACRHAIHLKGQPNVGPRDRGRDFELRGIYCDNDVVDTGPSDLPLMIFDLDGCDFQTIHVKGSRQGRDRPEIVIAGEDFRGGQFRLYGSSGHRDPEFKISGAGHQFYVRAAGMDSAEKATLFNGKPSYPGVTVR